MERKHIYRIEKNRNYTTMSNHHLNNKTLSWKAKGLHSYILSKPDDWKVIVEELVKASSDGHTSTRSAIQELHANRYWKKYPVYINGIIDHWETVIYETPFEEKKKIKTVKYTANEKTSEKIVLYENGAKQIEKVAQPQENQILDGNLKVDFLEEENLEEENGILLNTNILNTQSVSPSKKKKNLNVLTD